VCGGRVLHEHRQCPGRVRQQAVGVDDRAKGRVEPGHQLAELRTVADCQALRLGGGADGLALALLGREPALDQVCEVAAARLRHIIRERAHLVGQHQTQVVFVDGVAGPAFTR